MTPPVKPIDGLMADNPMFARKADGSPIARQSACECGKKFTQRLLSERFLTIVEKHSRRAMEIFAKQVPGFFVPVHCPKCEGRDLAHAARIAESRDVQPPFGERSDAA